MHGEYMFKVYGAQGGNGYYLGKVKSSGGKGAFINGQCHFSSKKTLKIMVGGQGASGKAGPNSGGWPNGGSSGEDTGPTHWGDASGGGGSASSVYVGDEKLLIAGGGAGGVWKMNGCGGGGFNTHFCPGDGKFCTEVQETEHGDPNGYGGTGKSYFTVPGSGGGGGNYGGNASGDHCNVNPEKAMACSGSSFFNPNYFTVFKPTVEVDQNEGNGFISIIPIYECKSECADCNSSTTCISCPNGKYLYNGNCIDQCEESFYIDNGECRKCPDSCDTCTSRNQCTKCKPGYFLKDGTCQQCSSKCDECSGSADQCTACKDGYNLYNSTCQAQCPVGTYETNISTCAQCSSNCLSCSGSPDYCTSCKDGYYLPIDGHCQIITPMYTPFNTPILTPVYTPYSTPFDSPYNTPFDTPFNTPFDSPINTPLGTPFDTPFNTPFDSPINTPFNTPDNTPLGTTFESPITTPFNTPLETIHATYYNTYVETVFETPIINTPLDSSYESSDESPFSTIDYTQSIAPDTTHIVTNDTQNQESVEMELSSDDNELIHNGNININKTKKNNAVIYGIVGGLAALLVIVAIVIIIIIHNKRKSQSEDFTSDEFEEECVIQSTANECQTYDNPLWETELLNDDNDLFNEDFEEYWCYTGEII